MKPPLFSCLTSRVANNGSLYGRFLFGPLPIDLSLTVATILRRSLLHSQATFTIVSAEIEGATHEYAALPGIQESILEILLNLGEIVLTSTQRNFIRPNFRPCAGSARQDVTPEFSFAFIRISGPGIVTAKDINWPKGIFCVKPNSLIATLSSNETLTMRLKIACSLNRNRQSFSKIETKPQKFTSPTPHLDSTSFNSDPLILSNNVPGFDRKLASPLFIDKRENKDNEKNENELFNANKNPFDFFKLSGNVSTISSVNSFSDESLLPTSESYDLIKIKKKVSVNRVLGKAQNKINKKLQTTQTQPWAHLVVTKPRGFDDSYSIRKQNLAGVPFSPVLSEQSIFNKTTSQTKENVNTSENEKDEQNTITFRVFPDLFKDVADLSFQKTQSFSHLRQPVKLQEGETELNSLNKIKTIQEQDLIDLKSQKLKSFSQKIKQTEKHELAVSSSSYPVEKVNFLIERDDELAGYRHRIILEVWTNGSISPKQAIFDSLGSIIKLIFNFREPLRSSFNDDFFSDSFID